jgi:hypothetical protein
MVSTKFLYRGKHWTRYPARAVNKFYVAVDLGQASDPTAIAVIHHQVEPLSDWKVDERHCTLKQRTEERFDVRHLERLPLGMTYPAQVMHVAQMLSRPPLRDAELAIDETGVGRPVGDMFQQHGLKPTRVTITSGQEQSRAGPYSWHVPKNILIPNLEARMHSGELRISNALSEAPALRDELKDFQRKIAETGRSTWTARTGQHDDLVLALAIGVWAAVGRPRSDVGVGFFKGLY